MSAYGVELVDEQGWVVAGPADLFVLAAPFLHAMIGQDVAGLTVMFLITPIPSLDNELPGDHPLAYHSERFGYIQIIIQGGGRVIYRHPHTVGEVVEIGLRGWLALEPRRAMVAGYRLVGPDIVAGSERLTPAVAGVTVVEPYAPGEKPSFRLRPLAPPPPPRRSLADFGVAATAEVAAAGRFRTDQVTVVSAPRVLDTLAGQPYSAEVEEGGFLVGRVYEDADHPGCYLSCVTAAVPARQTGASLLHFTFTGDSFDHIKGTLQRDFPGQNLLGWYHTHLFPATTDLGLSSIDHRLHRSTFRLPWQVAGLINVDSTDRTLRFYAQDSAGLAQRSAGLRLCSHHATDRG